MKVGDNMNLGDNIKKIRKEKGLTQKQLGEKLGVSQAAIGQFESGKQNLKIDTLHKIAEALNVAIQDIVSDDYYFDGTHDGKNLTLTEAYLTICKMDEVSLINFYRQLNDIGKAEAYKRVGELTLIEDYKTTEKQKVTLEYATGLTPELAEHIYTTPQAFTISKKE